MEEAIRFYYGKNFKYKSILECLEKYHDIKICKRTLVTKLQDYGLGRRYNASSEQARAYIERELHANGNLLGYRAMWRKLQSNYGMRVRRLTVQKILKELDPEGCEARKAHKLQRREYLNPGPNFTWHADGYDKLKQFGFPIHGCIDGFSRRIMWLEIVRTNNDPRVIGELFLDCVKSLNGCPTVLRTDKGTENGLMASAQCYLRRNHRDHHNELKAHRYGSSHSNQRIEAWWAMLRRSWSSQWIDFFKNLVDRGLVDTSNTIHLECLWFCFINMMRTSLDSIKESWNTHYVRKSRYHTAHGIPDQLFFLPESVNSVDHKMEYAQCDFNEIKDSVAVEDDELHKTYQEYFQYNFSTLQLQEPQTRTDALNNYEQLVAAAQM